MSLFVKHTDEDGTVTFVEAPEEVVVETVKTHPLHQSVLKEHIESRHKLKELRSKLEEGDVKPPAQNQAPAPKTNDAPAPTLDIDALTAQLTEKITGQVVEKLAAKQTEAQVRQNKIDGAVANYKLPRTPEVIAILSTAADPEETAKLLSKTGLQLEVDPVAGAAANPDVIDRVRERLGLKK